VDFGLSDEQRELQRTLRRYLEQHAPTHVVAAHDREERYPQAIIDGLAGLGVWGMCISPEYGGSGADPVSVAIACEELQRAGGCIASAITPTMTFCAPGIERHGTEAQRRDLLPGIAAGRIRMSIGLSEPDVGSDLSRTSMRAERVDGGFLVSGRKTWSTGADVADYVFALVRTGEPDSGYRGLSMLLLPRVGAQLTVRPIAKMAAQGTHSCEVAADRAFVPEDRLVGDEGAGGRIALELLEVERVYAAAQCVGMAQGAYDTALAYAREREQFGRPVIEHQAVAHTLASMATDVECARLAASWAAWQLTQPSPHTTVASMAKIACSEIATSVVARGMRVMGAYSYSVDHPMERWYREAKLFEIAAGTNEILRNVLAKRLQPGPAAGW
jgi:alkylation response protein AidB-like acyl-CoA dehydrogenase